MNTVKIATPVKNIIPSVNMADFLSTDNNRRIKFINEFGNAFKDIGFASVANHNISYELVEQFYEQSRLFFKLPTKIKEKYIIKGAGGQRGYTAFGMEHAKGAAGYDLKEFWQFGETDNPNVEELENFIPVSMKLFENFENTGRLLMQAIAMYLGLDRFYFDDKIENGNSVLRSLHYPPLTKDPDSNVRAGAHEDINFITLLVGASAEGLEVMNKQGQWIPAKPQQDHIMVNVGDMLQRLTNDRLVSTTHRVVNPPKEKWGIPRLSIPFFLHPKKEVSLAVLENCIDKDNPKKYNDITAIQYLDQRLAEIGLKK